ncbi:AAA family ATPase [Anoxynatronum buryatiense]|uniref:Predicted ATPase n=1 Tax=Anoxynatronum buryatiense TaxID=489973 RepID=A0AA45WTV1_9CLOT|nr:AAA family ATPase [Anoxynatronum buryatiense]SMP43874.1 Predicted ATPase [Anoxynatronum buryatiense]
MLVVTVTMLDIPGVSLDNRPVKLPYRKAEAVFYYLACRQKATRDELMHLLWGDFPEETARKNLRNALYKIRKAFDEEVLIAIGQSEIRLNPNFQWVIDVEQFNGDEPEAWQHYRQEFLRGFSVKDAVEFEDWMLAERQRLQQQYLRKLQYVLKNAQQSGDQEIMLQVAEEMVLQDPFDEKARRILMQVYADRGEAHRAIQEFESVTAMLREELGIQPEAETRKLAETLQKQRQEPASPQKPTVGEKRIFGRQREWHQLEQALETFRRQQQSGIVVVSGEAGVGKTMLLETFLEEAVTDHFPIFQANCYQQEESFFLKPWQPVFSRLADLIETEGIQLPRQWLALIAGQFPIFETLLNSDKGETETPMGLYDSRPNQPLMEAVTGIFKKITENRPVVIFFEDIHWMDRVSLQLMQRLLQESRLPLLFLTTVRSGYEDQLAAFMATLVRRPLFQRVSLACFNEKETFQWVQEASRRLTETHRPDETTCRQIFKETGGNPFFVAEYLYALQHQTQPGQLTPKAQDILRSRLCEFSQETRKLLELVSLFFHRVSLNLLADLTSEDEMTTLEMIQQLIQRGMLREVDDGHKISMAFNHEKFREYVYQQQPPVKRKLLHRRVGVQLEKQLTGSTGDVLRYTDLIHHFKLGGDHRQTLKYTLAYLNAYLDYYHELFPSVMHPRELSKQSLLMPREEALLYFEQVEDMLTRLEPEDLAEAEVQSWKIAYFHVKGRLLIREGDYHEGVSTTRNMIRLAEETGNWRYAVHGFQQLINYGIQTQQPEVMRVNLEAAMNLAEARGLTDRVPVLLRLQGLYLLIQHHFDQAESVLEQAIETVNKMPEKHRHQVVHVAACRYYLGEIMRNRQQWGEAIVHYQRAITECGEQEARHHSIAVFHTGMGQAYYEMNRIADAERSLQQALEHFRAFDIYWRRSIANAYMALILAEKGDGKQAGHYLQEATRYAEKLQNPYELGVVKRVQELVHQRLSEES